jgi:acetoin utilization deacetylase AcuC-like enzyme
MDFHGLNKVAIIDIDVHQGTGTVDIFEDDPRVMFCSSFQHPFYPNSHYDTSKSHIINTPLKAGTNSKEFRNLVESDWLDKLQNHKPELVIISAGFDAHKDDPMGQVELQDDDYQWVTEMLLDVADRYSDSRVVSVLEGGYNLKALADSVERHLQVLTGND